MYKVEIILYADEKDGLKMTAIAVKCALLLAGNIACSVGVSNIVGRSHSRQIRDSYFRSLGHAPETNPNCSRFINLASRITPLVLGMISALFLIPPCSLATTAGFVVVALLVTLLDQKISDVARLNGLFLTMLFSL